MVGGRVALPITNWKIRPSVYRLFAFSLETRSRPIEESTPEMACGIGSSQLLFPATVEFNSPLNDSTDGRKWGTKKVSF
jgi:hypothetical protein